MSYGTGEYACQVLPLADPHCLENGSRFCKSSRFVTDDNVCRGERQSLMQVSYNYPTQVKRHQPSCFEILSRAGADPTVVGDPRGHLSPLLEGLNAYVHPHVRPRMIPICHICSHSLVTVTYIPQGK